MSLTLLYFELVLALIIVNTTVPSLGLVELAVRSVTSCLFSDPLPGTLITSAGAGPEREPGID